MHNFYSFIEGDKEVLLSLIFSHCNTVFKAMGCFDKIFPYQGVHPSLAYEINQRGKKKRGLDEFRRK